ncbi:SusC/RagA family TonB-linked outer membrane protein [Bacteroidia bacterium]|nr:SusC/RagA family TonB-linked outer membrane protein [Bacteroidia bacterium]
MQGGGVQPVHAESPQDAKIALSGVVSDADGPIIGASVIEKGNPSNGVATDVDGKYTLRVSANATLQVSYLGYSTQDVSVNGRTSINITLAEDSKSLEEVVVVGYGTQKKENLTGAVVSVDTKVLESRPIADVGRSLQGAVSGLNIVIPDGEVGSDPIFKIRGQIASISGTSNPLILLDNVEIPSIQVVNPDDIESISVLKDAAASSIYGAKAAFGVVLITTKKGTKNDKTTVTYSNNFSWSKVAKDINMATIDGVEYSVLAMERIDRTKDGDFWSFSRESYERSKAWIQKYGNSVGPNDPVVFGRDWYVDGTNKMGVRTYNAYDYMIDEWTPTQTHNLSINGSAGGGKTKYNIGLGYFDQDGLLKTAKKDNFQRYNATVKVSSDINKYVTVRGGMLYSQRTKSYPWATFNDHYNEWATIYRWGPLHAFGTDQHGNPIRSAAFEAGAANTATRQTNYTNVNLGATINITKNWTLDADYTFANNEYLLEKPGTHYTAANDWVAAVPWTGADGNQVYVNENGDVVSPGAAGAIPGHQLSYYTYAGPGSGVDEIWRELSNNAQHTTNVYTTYNLTLNDMNHFKFMAGMNVVESKSVSVSLDKSNLLDINNPQFDLATDIYLPVTGGKTYWEATQGYFGRINYDYAQKYLLEANLRYDGSSKFPRIPVDLKWRWFPSFSAGWRASEESFMQALQPALNTLKFRGSWGTIGDQSIPTSSSLYVPTISSSTTGWLNGSNRVNAYTTPPAVDGSITWQDIETLDFGVDARFLNSELGVTFDWYNRYTRNMLTPGIELPYTFGTSAPIGNYGELKTEGWEIAIDFNHRFSNGLGITAMATLSDAVSFITGYPEAAAKTISEARDMRASTYYKGKRYGDIWGYQTDRLYQKDDFEYNPDGTLQTIVVDGTTMNKLKGDNPVYQTFLQNSSNFMFGPGDVKYKNLDDDDRITNGSGTEDDPGDMRVIGNFTPRYEYGFRVGADYKGVDFSAFFQGIGSRQIWGDGCLVIPGYNTTNGAMSQAIAGDFWREDRIGAFYPRPFNLGVNGGEATYLRNNTHIQDRYLLDMSYLRLKNVTLGYTLPADLLRKVYISNARVYMSMENIITWDHLNGLPVDPEVISGNSMYSSTISGYGRTGVGAPMFKNVSFGIQLTF